MKTLNKYSVESCAQLMEMDLLNIEASVANISDAELACILRTGGRGASLKRSLQHGEVVLLSESPVVPLLLKEGDCYVRNAEAAGHFMDSVWSNLTKRFSILAEQEIKSAGSYVSLSEDNEVIDLTEYKPEPPVEDPLEYPRKITVEDHTSSYLAKYSNRYNGLPFQILLPNDDKIEEGNIANSLFRTASYPRRENRKFLLLPDEGQPSELSAEVFGTDNSIKFQTTEAALQGQAVTVYPPKDGDVDIRLARLPFDGAIVIPSLACPVLVNPSQKAPARLLLALDNKFETIINQDPGKEKEGAVVLGGKHSVMAVLQHINVQEMAEKTKLEGSEPLFEKYVDGIKHVQVRLLGKLSGKRQFVSNGDGEAWCVIRDTSAAEFHKAGLTCLVEVCISPKGFKGTKLAEEGLHDLGWLSCTKEGGDHYETHNRQGRKDNPADVEQVFYEPQDILQKKWLDKIDKGKKGRYHFDDLENVSRERLRDPNNSDAGFASTNDTPIIQRHPVYVRTKKYLNPGQLSDVHVSSRQNLFLRSKAQVIPGASEEDSPFIGNMVGNNFLALKDLMDQMGDDEKRNKQQRDDKKKGEIDLLVITGDLIDHCVNLDPEKSQATNTGGIWRDVDLDLVKSDHELYPKYIDDTAVYGLFEYFMVKYQKPIILVSGNHEAYGIPYGISPRVLGVKANEGIPADHNLTIYEACLMYGPTYGDIEDSFNFNKNNLSWFYQVFSPVSDMVIPFKDQRFLGLEWGDDEAFIEPFPRGGGTLPRSTESCNAEQLKLIQQVAKNKQGMNILLTHFTFVNYATGTPVTDESEIDIDDVHLDAPQTTFHHRGSIVITRDSRGDETHADEGSFYKRRKIVFEDHIKTGHFKYCLAGHSHRAGLYYIKGEPTGDTWKVAGEVPGLVQPFDIKGLSSNATRIVVSGSSGPVSKQNFKNELAGQGMSPPQGLWIDVEKDKIELVKCSLKESKPRFAVAVEYMKRIKKKEVFKQFFIVKGNPPTNIIREGAQIVVLHKKSSIVFGKEFTKNAVGEIKLHKVNKKTLKYLGSCSVKVVDGAIASSDSAASFLARAEREIHKRQVVFYASLHFTDSALDKKIYNDYAFDVPLCLPMKIIQRLSGEYARWDFSIGDEHPNDGLIDDLQEVFPNEYSV